jgi:nitrate/nitrite transport system ATP-binding protein
VDEALYLSDRILVMSDGPDSCIAESLSVALPRPRDRNLLLRSPQYHEMRAHLLEFLTRGGRPAVAPDREPSLAPLPTALPTAQPALEPGK